MRIIFLVAFLGSLLWGTVAPRHMWRLLSSWQYKHPEYNEPSDLSFTFSRISCGVTLVLISVPLATDIAEQHAERAREVAAELQEAGRDAFCVSEILPALGPIDYIHGRSWDTEVQEEKISQIVAEHPEEDLTFQIRTLWRGDQVIGGISGIEGDFNCFIPDAMAMFERPASKVSSEDNKICTTEIAPEIMSYIETYDIPASTYEDSAMKNIRVRNAAVTKLKATSANFDFTVVENIEKNSTDVIDGEGELVGYLSNMTTEFICVPPAD